MRLLTKTLLATAVLIATPMLAQAESDVVVGNGDATAHLDFEIVIPRILHLRVGSANAAIDLIHYDVPGANLGDGNAVTATSGGDISPGVVTASVLGNNGDITLSSSTIGALKDGGTNTISYDEITTTVATLNTVTPLPHPTLVDGSTGSVSLIAPATGVIAQDAQWTYTYDNNNVVAAGTYGGANVNNGRVTYTAAMP